VAQAQLLAYADDFWNLAVMFAAVPFFLPLMHRIRLRPAPALVGLYDRYGPTRSMQSSLLIGTPSSTLVPTIAKSFCPRPPVNPPSVPLI